MSCAPRDIWALACRLAAEPGADEATLRSAMSRAYYAAHLLARQAFPEDAANPRDRKTEGAHEYVIRRAREYGEDKSKPLRREAGLVAMRLDHCRRERAYADYNIGGTLKPSSVAEQMKRVALILDLCDQIEAA